MTLTLEKETVEEPTPLQRLVPGSDSPWPGRLAFLAFAGVLFALPSIITDPTQLRLWAEWLCFAMVAVGLDIAWGYGGMLALGQGLFFGLGAYCMAMYHQLDNRRAGQVVPGFMELYGGYTELPLLWRPFQNMWFAWAAAILLPTVIAVLLGLLLFKRRIRGPFFAIITQATAVIFALLIIANLKLTAGTNGLQDYRSVFGHRKASADTKEWLYRMAAISLLVVLAIAMVVVRSRFGKLLKAVRDSENRVRFLGYDPAVVKTIAFAISAAMAGFAGAVAAGIFLTVTPAQFGFEASILMVCWVAVGGRGVLWAAVLGALLVNFGKEEISSQWPERWMYVQGALFVLVLAFFPGGIAGMARSAGDLVRKRVAS